MDDHQRRKAAAPNVTTATNHSPTRRDLLRLAGAVVLASGAPRLLSGCADNRGDAATGDSSSVIIRGGDVLTLDPERRVLLGGSVGFNGGTIVAVGSRTEVEEALPGADVVDATGCVVTPGFINTHIHLTGDPLTRSLIPDALPASSGHHRYAIPLLEAHEQRDDELGVALSAAECLLTGVTTVLEACTLVFPEAAVSALAETGIRARVGPWGQDQGEGSFVVSTDEVLDRQRVLLDAYPPGGRIEGWITLQGHSLMSDELIVAAHQLAERRGVPWTFHMSSTPTDPTDFVERTGRRPFAYLDDLGVLDRSLVVSHPTWIDDDELQRILANEVAVSFCPWAFLRKAGRMTTAGRWPQLVAGHARLSWGTDESNAGDLVDLLTVARLGIGIVRDLTGDPTSAGAATGLELLTVAGAESVGLDDRIGSLEVGKRADVVVHGGTISWVPRTDPLQQLFWGADGRSVRDVWVDGRRVVADRRCLTVDVDALRLEAQARSAALLARAGVVPEPAWPGIDASH